MTRLMPETGTTSRNHWPSLLILIGLLFAALTVWSLKRSQVPGRAVTAGYAAKIDPDAAAEWDSRGWTCRFSIDQSMFSCDLRDRSGLPLSGAQGSLLLSGVPTATHAMPLAEAAPGLYRVKLPAGLAGLHSAQLTIAHDGAHLSRNLQLQLAGRL